MLDAVRDSLVSAYYDNSQLLDTMLEIDGFLADIADIYSYPNWFEGEIIAGPSVKRYWVTIVLKYDYHKMPDPDGGLVLTRLGCKVLYKKFKQKVEVEVKNQSDLGARNRPKTKEEPCWLVKIIIPKKFLDDKKLKDIEVMNDAGIDAESVEDSINQGLETDGTANQDQQAMGQEPGSIQEPNQEMQALGNVTQTNKQPGNI